MSFIFSTLRRTRDGRLIGQNNGGWGHLFDDMRDQRIRDRAVLARIADLLGEAEMPHAEIPEPDHFQDPTDTTWDYENFRDLRNYESQFTEDENLSYMDEPIDPRWEGLEDDLAVMRRGSIVDPEEIYGDGLSAVHLANADAHGVSAGSRRDIYGTRRQREWWPVLEAAH